MKKIIYIKNNASRNPKYQTKTEIVDIDGKRFVRKTALSNKAVPFVKSLSDKCRMADSIFSNIRALPLENHDGIDYYPFIHGKSLDSIFKEKINNGVGIVSAIRDIFEKYYHKSESVGTEFIPDEGFHEIFGNGFDGRISGECIRPANLDMIFENVIVREDGSVILYDYEWTFDLTAPVYFVKFRVLSHLYDKYFSIVSEKFDFEDFCKEFDISHEEFLLCMDLEKAFISGIYSGGEKAVTDSRLFYSNRTLTDINDSFVLSEQELPKTRDAFKETLNNLNGAAVTMTNLQKENIVLQNEKNNLQNQNNNLQGTLDYMQNSKSWKVTKPLRSVIGVSNNIKREGFVHWAQEYLSKKELENNGYELIRSEKELKKERNYHFSKKVKISILTPLFNTPIPYLRDMIESALNQTYSNLELVLIDFSPKENIEIEATVREYLEKDDRIHYERSDHNIGIAENTNMCAAKASGDYFAILDHDDILHPSAFFEVMKEIEKGADFVYTDEIKFTTDITHPFEPNYKPDFSREQLQTQNYICHLNVYSRELFDKVNGYRSGFNGSQDHDMVLRLTEVAEKIAHIPEILYYWRVHENSVASNIDAKPYATISGIKAVDEAYSREGLSYKVKCTFGNIPRYRIIVPDFIAGTIAVLIWGQESTDYYRRTLDSLETKLDRKVDIYIPSSIYKALKDSSYENIFLHAVKDEYLCNSYVSKATLKKFAEKVNAEYIWLIFSGIEINGEKCMSEYLSLISGRRASAVDSLILYQKGEERKIFSGGCYITGDEKQPIGLRGKSMSSDYEGFQADFTHVRSVSFLSNICSFYKKAAILSEDRDFLWTPFVYGVSDEKSLENVNIVRDENISINEDPYFSSEILKNHLE